MAFGRKKRKGEQEAIEADAPAEPAAQVPGEDSPADEEERLAVTAPGDGSFEPRAEAGSAPAPSGLEHDLSEATASAGDPAAAGVEAEPSPPAGDTATHDVATVEDGPTAAPTEHAPAADHASAEAEALGTAAGSPEPFAAPTASGQEGRGGPEHDGADEAAGAADRAGAAAAGAQSLIESRPEVLVAGAFAAGLIAARVLGALGGSR